MKHALLASTALALSAAGAVHAEITQVETPFGLARIEGAPLRGDVERLVVGDREVVRPDPDSAQQRVWIEAQVGDLLLVGLASTGNGCFDGYVWVHTAPEDDLRTTAQFGTCGGNLEISPEGEAVTVSMDSPNPNEGRLEYVYDGRKVTERVLGQQPSHSGPEASARNWIGHYPSELFEGSDWREPLVSLMGEASYKECQQSMDLVDSDGKMDLSEGWIAGIAFGNRFDTGTWCAVAINDDDRRLLVVQKARGGPPRMWGDARGPLPAPIIEAIAKVDPFFP